MMWVHGMSSRQARTKVIISVDTETSMGGAWKYPARRPLSIDQRIFCKQGDEAWGISLITQILRQHGMRATFFCEMLAAEVLGVGETERYVHYLMEQGQDVQLHAHPTFWFYARHLESRAGSASIRRLPPQSDQCSALAPELVRELLELGCDYFQRFSGERPAAFRAGGYSADQATLRVLRDLGIKIDSSYNPAFRHDNSFATSPLPANHIQLVECVWEFPVTVFHMTYPQNGGLMPFEISAISLREMKMVLEHAHRTGIEAVVAVLHSFSLVKPKDIFYSRFRLDRLVARRLRQFARYLAENTDKFEVTTFATIAREGIHEKQPPETMAHVGLLAPVMRKAVQAMNRLYWV